MDPASRRDALIDCERPWLEGRRFPRVVVALVIGVMVLAAGFLALLLP